MFEHIIVALHDREEMGDSLEKAAQLEHFTGARITVVQTCWDVVSEEPAQHFPQEEIDTIAGRLKATELNNLSAAIAEYRSRCAVVDAEVLWSKHHDEAVARYAVETGAHLIIAPRHHHSVVERLLLPPELKLAARARTPLLLTAGTPWKKRVNVLTAMDVSDTRHEAVNVQLHDVSRELAQVLGGELHLLTVSPASTSSVGPVEGLADYHRRSEQSRRDALDDFAATQGGEYAGLHIRRGIIDEAITEVAAEHQVGIVVVGTAGRTGLERLFVGNTAELLINRLRGLDLLMVPAPG